MRRALQDAPEVRAALLAAAWAQRIGLQPGNYWEGPIARHILAEYHRLGGTPDLWPAVEGIFSARLGLDRDAAGLNERQPIAHVSKDVAEAFGLTNLPNVMIED